MKLIGLIVLILSASAWGHVPLKTFERVDHFAFGSCNRHYNKQKLWGEILSTKPQLWIWGGDNVYPPNSATPYALREAYAYQSKHPGYRELVKRIPMMGTWDDHDYGINDGDASYKYKRESQDYLLTFLGVAENDPRRLREGVYHSEILGPKDQQVKFIMLDNRYHRRHGNMLGEEQWRWLDDELAFSDAKVHFIVSGLAVLAPRIYVSEEWRDDMVSYNRLIEIFKKHQDKGIVLLSGDKHFAHFFERDGFIEFMSSGLTHTVRVPLRPIVRQYYKNPFIGLHWGEVHLYWNEKPMRLKMSLRAQNGRIPQVRHYHLLNGQWSLVDQFNEGVMPMQILPRTPAISPVEEIEEVKVESENFDPTF